MPGTSLGAQFAICVKLVCPFSASGLASELTRRMYHLERVCTRLTLHPSLIVTRLAASFPIALPPVLHPCPALSFSPGSISLATLPFSTATSQSLLFLAHSLSGPSAPTPRLTPPAPSLDACPLPSSRPASCVSQPCSDVGGEGGGGWMTHSVMMQYHNTQLHSPTDRGTDERQPLAPSSWPALQPFLSP